MIRKAELYALAENITPPIIFRAFKKSSLYTWLVRNAGHYTSARTPQEVTITGGDLAGYKLKLDPTGVWQHEMISGEYDHELFEFLKSLSLEHKVIYDIGAHICYHSLAFATHVGDTGHVYAFEPNPANITRANEIITLNPTLSPRITAFNIALSNKPGSTLFLSTDDVEGGTSTGGFIDDASTLWERERYVDKVGFKTTTVALETIDGMIAAGRMKAPHILKVDVEGAEQLVLEGAAATLATHHPTIVIEFHSIYSAYSCMALLQKYAYQTEILKREPDGRVMIVAK